MDPNANLKEQLHLAGKMITFPPLDQAGPGPYKAMEFQADAVRLAELTIALHQWLINGGFLPTEWEKNRPQPPII